MLFVARVDDYDKASLCCLRAKCDKMKLNQRLTGRNNQGVALAGRLFLFITSRETAVVIAIITGGVKSTLSRAFQRTRISTYAKSPARKENKYRWYYTLFFNNFIKVLIYLWLCNAWDVIRNAYNNRKRSLVFFFYSLRCILVKMKRTYNRYVVPIVLIAIISAFWEN